MLKLFVMGIGQSTRYSDKSLSELTAEVQRRIPPGTTIAGQLACLNRLGDEAVLGLRVGKGLQLTVVLACGVLAQEFWLPLVVGVSGILALARAQLESNSAPAP